MLPVEHVKPTAHQQGGRLARGAIALATAVFATTLRAWIGLLNVSERVSVARRRKAYLLVRACSPARRAYEGVTVTVTGPARREG
jgi:inactivated superfamily I helicase